MNGTNGHEIRAPRHLDRSKFPHNDECEASVLGGVILRNDALDSIPDLEPGDFFNLRHAVVFQAIRALQAKQVPIDTVTLEVEIEKAGKLDAIGGVGFLGELALRVPTADNVVAYSEMVRRDARSRLVQIELASALARAQDWPHDPYELLSETVGTLQRIEIDRPAHSSSRAKKWAVSLAEFLGDDEPSDDDAEDWIIRDVLPRAESALWCGPMKSGKTWGAIDICISVALGTKWLGKFENTMGRPSRVMGIFMEDNKRRLRRRLWELTRPRGMTPNNKMLVENLAVSRVPFRIPDARCERELAAEIKAFGAELVVVDNLTRVMVGDPNKTTDAAAFTRAWQALVDETNATIVFLHHTKKPTGDQKNADPFDLIRGSGDFGAQARNIILTLPMRTDSEEKVSEVRMRGNLDLEVESFTLGFERKRHLDRWHAALVDRGPIEQIKGEVEKAKKESKVAKKRDEVRAEFDRRCQVAIKIAEVEKSVAGPRLGRELGMSERGVAPVLQHLLSTNVLRSAGKRGYELADADRQEGLL